MPHRLVLASTSPYRKALLTKAGLSFTTKRPDVNEEDFKSGDLSPLLLAKQLAKLKAQSVQSHELNPDTVVLGSDQVAHIEGNRIGKPGDHETAMSHLIRMQGKVLELITACALCIGEQVVTFECVSRLFPRRLSEEQLDRYLKRDRPYDCAGAFKWEESGIALFEKVESPDQSGIIGIPVIQLLNELEKFEIRPFQAEA